MGRPPRGGRIRHGHGPQLICNRSQRGTPWLFGLRAARTLHVVRERDGGPPRNYRARGEGESKQGSMKPSTRTFSASCVKLSFSGSRGYHKLSKGEDDPISRLQEEEDGRSIISYECSVLYCLLYLMLTKKMSGPRPLSNKRNSGVGMLVTMPIRICTAGEAIRAIIIRSDIEILCPAGEAIRNSGSSFVQSR